MIDLSFENKLTPQKGRVLISDPFKSSEYFERSVVYLCEHDDKSSFGFVLNKPILVGIEGLSEAFHQEPVKAFKGGPCEEDSLFFLHTIGDKMKESQLISNEIYLGTNFNDLYEIMTPDLLEEGAIKLFIGYSGWSEGQLEAEIERNAWVVAEVDDNAEIMLHKEDLWTYFMTKLGKKYHLMTKFPLNPNYN